MSAPVGDVDSVHQIGPATRKRPGPWHQEDAMWAVQNGACAMCLGPFENSRACSVDHCHATGAVRGLLCHQCNMVLGMARDRPDVLRAGMDYLADSPGSWV